MAAIEKPETKLSEPAEFARLDILNRLSEIEKGLDAVDPKIPVHLMHIHKSLQQFEELVHLLPDEQVVILMRGYQQYKKVELVKEAATKKGGKKALSKTTLDDI